MRQKTVQRGLCTAVALVAAVVAVSGCSASGSDKAGGERKAAATVLTMANGLGDAEELAPFAAAVARLSGGTLRIEFKNGSARRARDYERRIVNGVKAGTTELGWVGTRAFDDVGVASFDALHAPLLIDSYALERRTLESSLANEMLAGLTSAGVVGVGILPGPLRKAAGVAPLLRPADFDGRRIALQRSQVAARTLRALGATSEPIPSGGAIDRYDGVEQQVASIAGNLYDKVAGYVTANVTLWPRPMVLFANPKAFNALTAKQRAALLGAARSAIAATQAVQRATEQEGRDILCRRGARFVTATAADVSALRRAVAPVYARLQRDALTNAAIARIRQLRADVGAPPDAPACARATQPVAPAKATPIDGVYRFTTTAKQLRAMGSPELVVPENYGTWTWVLDAGRFTYTQRNGKAREHATGTYSVTGDIFSVTVREADGVYPTGASAKPGERFSFRWSAYRDRLTLRPVKGEISPEVHRVTPWRRVGDAPVPSGG